MARTIYGRRRALVTGGAGFLGSHLIDRLLARGDEVLCVDNLFTGDKSNRVHFASTFIPEADIPAYFAAAGAVALTYTRSFVSQSAVLQIAALFDRPLLASGGEGPLRETVERFGLGLTVEPDSVEAIAAGLRRLIAERPEVAEGFARYRATTSWQVNVDRLLEVVAASRRRAV